MQDKKDKKDIKQKNKNVRLIALNVIYQTMTGEEFIDKVLAETLDKSWYLSRQEKSFLSRLSKGVVERALELDYVIYYLMDNKNAKLKPIVRDVLRMGIYQIIYMDSVPDSAAVNESVKLLEIKKVSALKSFVNGLLRNAVRMKDEIPYPMLKKDPVKHYSVWYSCPEWIVRYLMENYPENVEQILKSQFEADRETTVRVMQSKTGIDAAIKGLKAQDISVRPGEFFPYALKISDFGSLMEVSEFSKGNLQVQDESSMLVGAVADVCGLLAKKENSTDVSESKEDSAGLSVLDICAAPGGKSIHIADDLRRYVFENPDSRKKTETPEDEADSAKAANMIYEGESRVTSCDLSKQKVKLIRENLKRLGIHNVKLKQQDATEFVDEFREKFDLIIADLPCSGLGVLSKKCDIKYKTKYKDIKELSKIQKNILINAVKYLKPGGTLIFSTCTITKEENAGNFDWICEKLKLTPVSIEDRLPEALKGKTGEQGFIQLLPGETGADGFFVSKFVKQA